MTRPLFPSPSQLRTTLALLVTILALAVVRTVLVHHIRSRDFQVSALRLPSAQARRLAYGLLVPGKHEAVALFEHVRDFLKQVGSATHASLQEAKEAKVPMPTHAVPTQLQRVRHVVARLSFYDGYGVGRAGVTHLALSVTGVVGMFAAIVGALLGPWLAHDGGDALDEEGYSFWACEEEQGDARMCGQAREERLWLMRLFELA